MTQKCIVCKTPTKKTCTGCKMTAYCSTACQRKHWIIHIVECSNPGREITTADRMAANIFGPNYDNHAQTMIDYGFYKVTDPMDIRRLRLLYREVIQDFGVKPHTLHKWRVEGRLHAELIKCFKSPTAPPSPQTLLWLHTHSDLFDQNHDTSGLASLRTIQSMERLTWYRIGGSPNDTDEQIRKIQRNWSDDRTMCFALYDTVLLMPGPALGAAKLWVVFGFCVLPDEGNTTTLSQLYRDLIDRTTFDEFCEAYKTSSLIALMDRKGLKQSRSNLPAEFEPVMNQSPSRISSIWHFKVHCRWPAHVVPASFLDLFGFAKCENDAETSRLRVLYDKAFNECLIPPFQLQEAASKNELYKVLTQTPKFRCSKAERRFLKRVLGLDETNLEDGNN
ncbi:hypothetical protein SISSUDRAFT_1008499 [Sistotremastrum suecicum HHB10207 ss-3]|uniref:MYND-type domain-containing protein n=1 Tax=Sistotremastrum suecicum HHB10207 ss-3 TaxID=1314776 RepID=A0A166ARD0_9AGAM|nr:hypothetical protein SISSUDRAFT_1008499 [Sistotremastrum suecicum HHB10207 ss-3]